MVQRIVPLLPGYLFVPEVACPLVCHSYRGVRPLLFGMHQALVTVEEMKLMGSEPEQFAVGAIVGLRGLQFADMEFVVVQRSKQAATVICLSMPEWKLSAPTFLLKQA